jgi:hypothetical protein
VEQRLRALPGIQSVCFASSLPYSNDEGNGPTEEIRLPGQVKGTGLKAVVNVISNPVLVCEYGNARFLGRFVFGHDGPSSGKYCCMAQS